VVDPASLADTGSVTTIVSGGFPNGPSSDPPFADRLRVVLTVSGRVEPFRRGDLAVRLLPFAVAATAGALTPIGEGRVGMRFAGLIVGAGVVALLTLGVLLLVPWVHLPEDAQLLTPLGYTATVVLLQAGTERHLLFFEPLLALPIFWLALYHRGRDLGIGIVVVLGIVVGSALLQSEPLRAWPEVLFWPVASAALGLTIHRLLARVREQRAALEVLARTDPLTGAVNRRAWDEELEHSLALAERLGYRVQVAMLDLDGFKTWNDQHGHQAGDRLLEQLVSGWRRLLRRVDLVARFGGDEFAVLMPGSGATEAGAVVERLRTCVPAPLSCSAGLTEWHPGEGAAEVVSRADTALYMAKDAGRNRTVVLRWTITSASGTRVGG
jgi:diguanylate cyclase (GGDEF)-like protein